MNVIPVAEVNRYLAQRLKEWTFSKSVIHRDFEFKSFVEAFSFMTAIALEAEKMDHHPEWTNVYNKVTIGLSTHIPKGITQLDFDLAEKINTIYTGKKKA